MYTYFAIIKEKKKESFMSTNANGVLQKKWLTAFLLSLFLGGIGVDRFYLGKAGTGILKLITFGGFGLWYLIDLVLIFTKSMSGVEWVDGGKNDKQTALVIFGVVLAIGVFSIIAAPDSDTSTSGGSNTTKSQEKSVKEKPVQEKKSEENRTEFNAGETAIFDKRELTVTKVERNFQTGNEFSQPESGNEFIVVTVELKNNSKSSMSFNTFDFKLQDSNGVQKTEALAVAEGKLDYGDLAPGGKVSGKLSYEITSGDKNPKLIYSGSMFGKTITVNL